MFSSLDTGQSREWPVKCSTSIQCQHEQLRTNISLNLAGGRTCPSSRRTGLMGPARVLIVYARDSDACSRSDTNLAIHRMPFPHICTGIHHASGLTRFNLTQRPRNVITGQMRQGRLLGGRSADTNSWRRINRDSCFEVASVTSGVTGHGDALCKRAYKVAYEVTLASDRDSQGVC